MRKTLHTLTAAEKDAAVDTLVVAHRALLRVMDKEAAATVLMSYATSASSKSHLIEARREYAENLLKGSPVKTVSIPHYVVVSTGFVVFTAWHVAQVLKGLYFSLAGG